MLWLPRWFQALRSVGQFAVTFLLPASLREGAAIPDLDARWAVSSAA